VRFETYIISSSSNLAGIPILILLAVIIVTDNGPYAHDATVPLTRKERWKSQGHFQRHGMCRDSDYILGKRISIQRTRGEYKGHVYHFECVVHYSITPGHEARIFPLAIFPSISRTQKNSAADESSNPCYLNSIESETLLKTYLEESNRSPDGLQPKLVLMMMTADTC
jgi:hypothetical protein